MKEFNLQPVYVKLTLEQEESVVLASLGKFIHNLKVEGEHSISDAHENAHVIRSLEKVMRYYGD